MLTVEGITMVVPEVFMSQTGESNKLCNTFVCNFVGITRNKKVYNRK